MSPFHVDPRTPASPKIMEEEDERLPPLIDPAGSKVEVGPDILANTFLPHLLPAGYIENCSICSKVGEHCTARCPYKDRFPKGVHVGSGWEVVCWNCGTKISGKCCGMDYGRAIPKRCFHCSSTGKHWSTECPRKDPIKEMPYPPSLFKFSDSRKAGETKAQS